MPIPVGDRPWKDVSLDFVTGLPTSENCNTILTVADRMSKLRHLILCTAGDEAEGTSTDETAILLIQHVKKLYGLSETMISDRGPQFISELWKALCKQLRIKAKISSVGRGPKGRSEAM